MLKLDKYIACDQSWTVRYEMQGLPLISTNQKLNGLSKYYQLYTCRVSNETITKA